MDDGTSQDILSSKTKAGLLRVSDDGLLQSSRLALLGFKTMLCSSKSQLIAQIIAGDFACPNNHALSVKCTLTSWLMQ